MAKSDYEEGYRRGQEEKSDTSLMDELYTGLLGVPDPGKDDRQQGHQDGTRDRLQREYEEKKD